MKTKKARLERYEVLRSNGRHPETGFKLPAVRVGFALALSPKAAISEALLAAGLPEDTDASAFLCPYGAEQEWANEARAAQGIK